MQYFLFSSSHVESRDKSNGDEDTWESSSCRILKNVNIKISIDFLSQLLENITETYASYCS